MSHLVMRNLIDELNKQTHLYNSGTPTITDKEWDDMYFKLENMEEKDGIVFPDSPTQKINYESVTKLKKVKHNHLMLSLDKTKDPEKIKAFIGSKDCIVMLKMDGLTCSLKYVDGELVQAETRGNGEEGEDIIHNVKVIPSVPQRIPLKGTVVVDGEIICRKNIFDKYFAKDYKNARNFAAGSIRLLEAEESAKRKLEFVAWDCIEGMEECINLNAKLDKLIVNGFNTVPWSTECDLYNCEALIKHAEMENYPIDGLVFKYDNCIEYAAAGRTDHHFKGGMAFKFYDEEYETRLRYIEYTMGRTGVLTPVAVFVPIEIDGATVERASLHNLSVMKELLGCPFVGQTLWIYKANEIIPQVRRSQGPIDGELVEFLEIPIECPICGGPLIRAMEFDSETLVCNNSDCDGKLINRIDHAIGKKGLDIKGISKATIEKLIDWGWVKQPSDIFTLAAHRAEWIQMPGFGVKSVDRILDAIEAGRYPRLDQFICALGIPKIGRVLSKELVKYIDSYEDFKNKAKSKWDFTQINGIAYEKADCIWNFDFTEADNLDSYLLGFTASSEETGASLEGQIICITGTLKLHKNRSELQSRIEAAGGKVTSAVSAKTTWLINNNPASTSSKNVSATRLSIPIITEEEFVNQFFGE